jgi:large subunit ribosomal protein L9
MKVILRSDIINIGRQGDVKEVAPGFARNFLVPKNLVMPATPQNLKIWEREKVKLEKVRQEAIDVAKELAIKIEENEFAPVKVNVGENGKIFGSVTTAIIAKAFSAAGFEISKKDILLSDNIKEIGSYEISVRLHPEVIAKAKFSIVSDKQ